MYICSTSVFLPIKSVGSVIFEKSDTVTLLKHYIDLEMKGSSNNLDKAKRKLERLVKP